MKCSRCNIEVSTRLIMGICSKCYQREKSNSKRKVYDLPKKGEVGYAPDGKVICHICGRAYTKLITHVYQIHGLTAKEYKSEFGLNLNSGLISKEHKEILRNNVYEHYDKCIISNLIGGGEATRYKNGSKGRTREKLSLQEYYRLVDYCKLSGYKNLKYNKNRGSSSEK